MHNSKKQKNSKKMRDNLIRIEKSILASHGFSVHSAAHMERSGPNSLG